MKRKLIKKLRSVKFWLSLAGAVVIALQLFGVKVSAPYINEVVSAVCSVFVVLGAVCAGGGTTATIDALGSVNAVAGAFMVALSAALAVYWMVSSGILVSTSQAIVGAIIGWNIYSHKPTNTDVLSVIVGSWVFCPLLSAGIAMVLYWLVKLWLRHSKMHLLRRDSYIRGGLIFLTAFGAYALGANNIANVMGVFVESSPFAAFSTEWLSLSPEQILFLIGALSIGAGIFTYSNKTIKTVGKNLMSMTPVIALIAVFAQSLVLFLFASQGLKGLLEAYGLPSLPLVPVSSSQAMIGAILGIGLAKGGRGINWVVILKIAAGWIATPVIAASICFISLFFLENVFRQIVFQ